MVEGNCQDIVNQEKKGVLTESEDIYDDIKDIDFKNLTTKDKEELKKLYIKSKSYYGKDNEQTKRWAEKCQKAGVIVEGCMTKKFENMTNREVASYIFSHPHTKFAGKMKECDDKEILKAIRDMKKEMSEEAPVTNTSAVATAPKPSMYLKRPEQEELKDNQ